MVVDNIGNRKLYGCLGARIAAGLEFIAGATNEEFSERTVEIDGKNLYAMFQGYETIPASERFYEAHRRYVDIQYLVSGSEIIRVRGANGLKLRETYNESDDYTLFDLTDDGTDVRLAPGDFVILYPHDAHAPKVAVGGPSSVEKIVVKVLVE